MMALMTQIEISEKRRSEIKQAVIKALENGNIFYLPLKIKAIVRSFSNIRLITFSKHMKKLNLSYERVVKLVESKDACTDYYADNNLYYIYYNDIDKNITKSGRYRWNIAHELGHILLQHHIDYEKTRVFRSNLSDETYDMLEAEADYFAQLILVPHAALIGFKIESYQNIRFMCEISRPASKKRFYEYSKWKKHIDPNDAYDNQIFHLFYPFIFKKECRFCGASLIQRYGKYCPICGNQPLIWGEGKMQYKIRYTLNEKSRLHQCSVCENENIPEDAIYCQICGTPVQNKCTSCGKLANSDARYCIYCGSTTTFNSKVLPDWKEELEKEIHAENGFINIPDAYDDEALPFN